MVIDGGVRQCLRCGLVQPPGAPGRPPACAACGGPLATLHWVAAPPAGLGPAPHVRQVSVPYAGPPRYPAPPGWGFPPVARLPRPGPGARGADATGSGARGADATGSGGSGPAARVAAPATPAAAARWTSAAIVLTLATSLVCAAAGAAETWRFVLMLRGRTEVLSASTVAASDALVSVSARIAPVLAIVAAVATARAIVLVTKRAARKLRRRPRSAVQIATRILVPGWNLIAAGPLLIETGRLVACAAGVRPTRRMRIVLGTAWASWAVNGVLAAGVLAGEIASATPWAWAHRTQFTADLVTAHLALDAVAAVTAFLVAASLAMLRSVVTGGRAPRIASSWLPLPPPTTARNRGEGRGAAGHQPEPGPRDAPTAARPAGQPMLALTPDSTGVESSASTTSAT